MRRSDIKNVTKLFASLAIVFGQAGSSTAQVSTDFDQDGRSDVTFTKAEADKSLTWSARQSATSEVRVLASFGRTTDQPIPANWFGSGQPSLATLTLEGSGKITWKFIDPVGTAIEKSFGEDGDLVVAGARFDGNDIGDAAVVRLEKTTAVWRVVTDFLSKDPATNQANFKFGTSGDRAFFVGLGDGFDWAAALGPGSGRNSRLKVRNVVTGEVRSYNRLPAYASTGERPRPIPVKQAAGPDLLAFQTIKGKKTLLRVIEINGNAVSQVEFDGTGLVAAGDFNEGPGEELAFDNGATLSIFNPKNAEVREFASTGGNLTDTINVGIVKSQSATKPPTNSGGSNGGGTSTGDVGKCNSVASWPKGHIYKTIGSNHFTDVRRNTAGIILAPGARGPTPSCLEILDSRGNVLARMGLYARGAGWVARYYAGIGCGAGTPFGGSSLAAKAKSNSGSSSIYANFGSVCYGPIDATRCIGSQQC